MVSDQGKNSSRSLAGIGQFREQVLQVLEWLQTVLFGRFNDAVGCGTGLGSELAEPIAEPFLFQPVFSAPRSLAETAGESLDSLGPQFTQFLSGFFSQKNQLLFSHDSIIASDKRS